MKYKEIVGLNTEEIEEQIVSLKQELAKERSSLASGIKSENPGKIGKMKKDIARLKTELNSRRGGKVVNAGN